ncbi:MAG: acyl carrier protein [Proteobacteria bacterium]|nr:acyl carrier protein [Pseudomonadota bacterium]
MSVESKIREWVLENYLFTEDPEALKNDDSFLDKGIIDSTGILEVIAYIEESFEIEVDDDEMVPENLDSVDNIVAYVARKKA